MWASTPDAHRPLRPINPNPRPARLHNFSRHIEEPPASFRDTLFGGMNADAALKLGGHGTKEEMHYIRPIYGADCVAWRITRGE